MKKIFTVLTLLIIGLIGASQTYAYETEPLVFVTSTPTLSLDAEQIAEWTRLRDNGLDIKWVENGETYILSYRGNESIGYTWSVESVDYLSNGRIVSFRYGDTMQLTMNGIQYTPSTTVEITENVPPITYDLSLSDLTDGASLTQAQDDLMNQMLQGTMDVTLSIDGVDHVLAYRRDIGTDPGFTELDVADGVGGWRVWYSSGNIYIKDDTGASPTGTFSLGMNIPPVISGSGGYLSDYDNPATVADVQATLTAIDDPDGDLTSSITVFEDNYTGNENVLGSHTITFQVSDAAGTDAQFIVTVQVVDITAPVITLVGDASITLGIGDTFTDPGVTVTDNADPSPTWNYDGGEHGVDTSTPGTYTITYRASDVDQNESSITRTVIVEDNQSPYVQSNVTSITTYNSQNLTLNAVLSGITVIDDHDVAFDGTYTVTVDNYTGNESIDGSYDVTITATDASGNVMTHTITIVVIDDVPPVISASDYLLTPEEVAAMTQAEIKAHIESRNP